MDKNILIAEILYIIFVHNKGLGRHYNTGKLKKEMYECMITAKLLYKDSLSAENIQQTNSIRCGQQLVPRTVF